MKQTYDIESLLFKELRANEELTAAITGDICYQRSDDSELEDVVINTIALTQEYLPQLATSNVNIHVPDLTVNIRGKEQKVENRSRLKELADMVLTTIRDARLNGLKMVVENQATIDQPEIDHHYCNIRISWIIH